VGPFSNQEVMAVKLPQDQDNWTGAHVDKLIMRAEKLFAKYEAKIDFTWPQEKQDDLYRPYMLARELAVQVASTVHWREAEAKALP
jgi:hypothetical protein